MVRALHTTFSCWVFLVFGVGVLLLTPPSEALSYKKFWHDRSRLGRGRGRHSDSCRSMGDILCTRNDVSVLERRTTDNNIHRLLQFGNECATQSMVVCKGMPSCRDCGDCPCAYEASQDLSASYMRTMFDALDPWCRRDHARVLMIGLGGGELPLYLLHHCPGMHVEAVELNEDVIALARTYFGVGEAELQFRERFEVQHNDSLSAVEARRATSPDSYDAVLVDCFRAGGEVPEACRSPAFAIGVRMLLRRDGVMLQNIWHFSDMNAKVAEEYEQTEDTYDDVFAGAIADLPVPMPPGIQWVDVLRMSKTSELKTIL